MCDELGLWTPCTVLHGRRRLKGKARAGDLQRWTSTSIVLGLERLDEGWGQDRAAAQHVSEVRGLPLLWCRAVL